MSPHRSPAPGKTLLGGGVRLADVPGLFDIVPTIISSAPLNAVIWEAHISNGALRSYRFTRTIFGASAA
jgi:hypothetical protein